jgi:cytochrome P450
MSATSIPAHVPQSLIGSFPLVLGQVTEENPFDRIIPDIHKGPVAMYVPGGYLGIEGAWVFRRAVDLQNVYADTEHFSVKDFAPFSKFLGDSWSLVPAEIDPPNHGFFRAALNPLFAPRRMAALEQRVRTYARQYIDEFKHKGQCEFVNEFAFRFPIAVFLELMGLPMSKVEEFLLWEKGLLHDPDVNNIIAATRAVKNYLLGEIEDRRKNPRDDLITYGLNAEMNGRKWTADELFGFCFNLFIGGMDTVSTTISLHFRHLAEHPAHQTFLRDHPDQIPTAIEELMRAYAPAMQARTCIKPVQIAGAQVMPGDKVIMTPMIANRDPEAFDNPNAIILDRHPRHLNFGYGVHRCLGAPLARREVIIALEEFLQAIPQFRIAPDAKIRTFLGGVIQPDCLPLVW